MSVNVVGVLSTRSRVVCSRSSYGFAPDIRRAICRSSGYSFEIAAALSTLAKVWALFYGFQMLNFQTESRANYALFDFSLK
jgi:hypothetical protein